MLDLLLDKTSPSPLYGQIADWMEQQVAEGKWQINLKLPSEDELAQELSVSRGTARKAIGQLVAKGILVQIQGRGTFVASRKVSQSLGQRLISFAEAMSEQGLVYKTIVLDKAVISAPPVIACKLGISEGEDVFMIRRVRTAGNQPIIMLENYVRHGLCPKLMEVDYETTTLFMAIEEFCDVRISWGKRDFEARAAQADQARLLQVNSGDPLLYLEQVTYTRTDVPIETSHVWIRGDQFRLTSVLSRDNLAQI